MVGNQPAEASSGLRVITSSGEAIARLVSLPVIGFGKSCPSFKRIRW